MLEIIGLFVLGLISGVLMARLALTMRAKDSYIEKLEDALSASKLNCRILEGQVKLLQVNFDELTKLRRIAWKAEFGLVESKNAKN
jgi:hypothetical protein